MVACRTNGQGHCVVSIPVVLIDEVRYCALQLLKHEWVELPLKARIADGDSLVAAAKVRMEKKQEEGRRAVAAASSTQDSSLQKT